MAGEKPTIIKKYANRRLYHTGTSTYVTLEDLARMVKNGEDFVVTDAKTGEDITRSVLGQIIFEQEGRGDQPLLPITFLRQLIRFYGDQVQTLLPTYLEILDRRLHPQPGQAARTDGARLFRRPARHDRRADAAQHGDVHRGDAHVDALRRRELRRRRRERPQFRRRGRHRSTRGERKGDRIPSAASFPRCRRRSTPSPGANSRPTR